MKKKQLIRRSICRTKTFLFALAYLGLWVPVYSQTETETTEAPADSTEVVADTETAPEKLTLRVNFEAFKINEDIKLSANLKMKVAGKFQQIPGIIVSFYRGETTEANLLGKDTSDYRGLAEWIVSGPLSSDSVGATSFLVIVQDHPVYEDVEEMVAVSPSKMDMTLELEDSVKMVKVTIGYPDETGQYSPLVGAECQLYVKRLFGYLPIGDPETTDESGLIAVVFPEDINGDENGNITVVVKISEHEIVGNVEANKTISWGKPTKVDNFHLERELWSARANSPVPLIILVNATLIGIWGVIAFIFLEIYRINKLGRVN